LIKAQAQFAAHGRGVIVVDTTQQPGWEYYAQKVEAERNERLENAKVVLKETHMNAGNTHYTFSIVQKKNTKPYLRISVCIEKMNYRGTIVVFGPYVPVFMGKLHELSKECFPY